MYFHTLFWPAMLKFSGRKVPDNIYVHGFITVSGEKMSKSRGTGIDPLRYLQLGMNPEWFRYYVAAKLNGRVEDIEFNPDDFLVRVNSDLIGKYVNIASRAASFLARHFDGACSSPGMISAGRRRTSDGFAFGSAEEIEECLRAARVWQGFAVEVMRIADVSQTNASISYRPWELAKDPAQQKQLLQAVCSVVIRCFPDADHLSCARAARDCRAGGTRTVRDGQSIQLERPAGAD